MTRIVVDPESLRRFASRMRGAATLLSSTGRQLASRPLPAMPASLASIVSESIARANAELQELTAGLVRDAGDLYRRAMWAEADFAPRSAWSFSEAERWSYPEADVAADAGQETVSEERLAAAEAWSVGLVESAPEALAAGEHASASDVSELRGLVAADLAETSEQLPPDRSPSVALTSEAAVGFLESLTANPGPPSSAGTAALGNAFGDLAATATGVGILGCIAVGGGFDAPDQGSGGSE